MNWSELLDYIAQRAFWFLVVAFVTAIVSSFLVGYYIGSR